MTERNREPVTTDNDQSPHTPDNLDDQLPPSLFAPPGRGTPPPLFGPVPPRRDAEPDPALPEKGDAGSTPPPLFRPAGEKTSPPDAGPAPVAPERGGLGSTPPPLFRPVGEGTPQPDTGAARVPGGDKVSPRGDDKPPSAPPRTVAPEYSESPDVSLRPGPVPGRPAQDLVATEGPAADSPAPTPGLPPTDGPAPAEGPGPVSERAGAEARGSVSARPAADGCGSVSERAGAEGRGPVSGRPAADGRAPASARPDADGSTPAPTRPAPLDGNLHLKPVRRLRTEPSAEWTPHPSYGAEPESPKREARDTSAKGADAGPDAELDLVLDLAPGDRATSATFSVPAPATAPSTVTTTTSVNPGRRHSVIANETTASIPVHLLFRDDQEPAEAAALPVPGPGAVVHRPAGDPAPATRPPVPRSPQTRVRPSTRPAPVGDPRLAERPGPALSGYAALLAGAAGTAGALAVLWWRGALPAGWQSAVGITPRPDLGIGVGAWAALALLATAVLLALGGLGRGRVGYAWVLTLFGDYRGTVRRTGLVWVSPLLLRRRVDVRLRHWRSEPLPAVDANGTALRVVVLVVWRIEDTVRAVLGIEDHEAYLSAQVEAAMARVLSQLPADAFHEDAPTLRDAEAVGDALTRMLKADCEPVGVEVYSAQPTGIEYAPEVAAAMQRRRIAAIDSRHRDSVLTSVVDAVDDTVNRLTTRGIVELDDYERKALVKDLTVAFYTGRSGGGDGA
ncbi:SPFH domain-containing protein [Streptomyces parvus]|uniref:SPFH domain-containing protein n=1 Tax=Streptomyces parvus TaxID=66428 RepID=UPI0028A8AD70|nr:SPFH domain-containing protein [Streptomyces parvus]